VAVLTPKARIGAFAGLVKGNAKAERGRKTAKVRVKAAKKFPGLINSVSA
jgi:hypothetical protein